MPAPTGESPSASVGPRNLLARNRRKTATNSRKSQENKRAKTADSESESDDDNIPLSDLSHVTNPRTKLDKMIRDIECNPKPTREQIVTVLTEAVQRAKVSYDFPLSRFLSKYMADKAAINFPQAGVMLQNAGIIYGKKVDNMYQDLCNAVAAASAAESLNDQEKSQQKKAPAGKKTRVSTKSLTFQKKFYEAEMNFEPFKKQTASNLVETLVNTSSFEPPKRFFNQFKKYWNWRKAQKLKCKNGAVSTSFVCDESFIHPELWKYSRIQDLDDDDDSETKRNYRLFTHYIEHRHSTLVPDINFLMHFKVKDFVEAEKDEIEALKVLGLPTPPCRVWPPFCRVVNANAQAVESFQTAAGSDEYIKNYVAVEDIALRNENAGLEYNTSKFHEARCKIFGTTRDSVIFCEIEQNVGISSAVDETVAEENIPGSNEIHDTVPEIFVSEQSTAVSVQTSGYASQSHFSESCINYSNNETTNINSTVSDAQDETINSNSVANDRVEEQAVNSCSDITDNSQDEGVCATQKDDSENTNENDKPRTRILQFVRASSSIDEGIFFEELDEVSHKLRTPVVELVNIFGKGPVDFGCPLENLVFSVDDDIPEIENSLRNSFGIDESYLQHSSDFSLPAEILNTRIELTSNIFRIPDSRLRKTRNFTLPKEFDIYKKNRTMKRKRIEEPPKSDRRIKMFKLNDTTILESPPSPSMPTDDCDEFLGFDLDAGDYEHFDALHLLSSTIAEIDPNLLTRRDENPKTYSARSPRSRNLSTDSGIQANSLTKDATLPASACSETGPIREGQHTENIPTENSASQLNDYENRINNCMKLTEENKPPGEFTVNFEQKIPLEVKYNVDETKGTFTNVKNKDEISKQMENEIDDVVLIATETENVNQNVENNQTNELIQEKIDALNEMNERIRNWHRNLKPILRRASERHYFDFFALGTEIIDTFRSDSAISNVMDDSQTSSSSSEPNDITMAQIMQNRDPTHLSRYIFSMLQLANTNNLKIKIFEKSDKDPVPLKNIKLQLLSRERYQIAAEDNINAEISNRRNLCATINSSDPVPSTSSAATADLLRNRPMKRKHNNTCITQYKDINNLENNNTQTSIEHTRKITNAPRTSTPIVQEQSQSNHPYQSDGSFYLNEISKRPRIVDDLESGIFSQFSH